MAAVPKAQRANPTAFEQDLAKALAKRDKLIEAISTGPFDAREVKADLDVATKKCDAIHAERAGAHAEPKLLEPGMSDRYRAGVEPIDRRLQRRGNPRRSDALHPLADRQDPHSTERRRDDLDIDLHGCIGDNSAVRGGS